MLVTYTSNCQIVLRIMTFEARARDIDIVVPLQLRWIHRAEKFFKRLRRGMKDALEVQLVRKRVVIIAAVKSGSHNVK